MQPTHPASSKATRPAMSAILFLGMVLAIAAVGLLVSGKGPSIVSGLPQAPEVLEASQHVRDQLRVETGGLRLETALLGENQAGEPFSATNLELAQRAEGLLERAAVQHPDDPRITGALAGLALVRRNYAEAMGRYREAIDRAAGYGEARLGLGVALALYAESTADPRQRRTIRLRALAQFANVLEADPAFAVALYNRALMLGRVGRLSEARRYAAEYGRVDSGSVWADALARELQSL